MTDQIVIKLNKKKFRPLLDSLMQHGTSSNYNEFVGKCVVYTYLCMKDKLYEKSGKSKEELILEVNRTYSKIKKDGFVPNCD